MIIKVYKFDESVWSTLKPNQKFIDISFPQGIFKRYGAANSYCAHESFDGRLKP